MPNPKDTLDRISVTTPCNEDWDDMVGNDQVRFCTHCSKNVQNLSAMTRADALRLVISSKGKLCVRFMRMPDGALRTADVVGQQLYTLKRRVSRIAAGAFTAALSVSSSAAAAAAPQYSSVFSKIGAVPILESGRKVGAANDGSTLTGVVLDSNGAVIPEIVVTAVNASTGAQFSTTANDEGEFRFESLTQGKYTVTFEGRMGFSSKTIEVSLNGNDSKRVKEVLDVAGSSMGGMMISSSPEEPLVLAAFNDDLGAVKELLQNGAKVDVLDEPYDATALDLAVSRGNREIVKALLEAGADANAKNEDNRTALMFVTSEASPEIIRDLVAAGADVNWRADDGAYVLLPVASNGNPEVLTALLEAGANVDAQNTDGRTALMFAAAQGNKDHVLILLEHGASVNLRDLEGKSALGFAMENQMAEVVKILESYGGTE